MTRDGVCEKNSYLRSDRCAWAEAASVPTPTPVEVKPSSHATAPNKGGHMNDMVPPTPTTNKYVMRPILKTQQQLINLKAICKKDIKCNICFKFRMKQSN